MDHQINAIKRQTDEFKKTSDDHAQKLIDLDEHFAMKENELFKKYHEDRLTRMKLEIEEGLTNQLGVTGLEINDEYNLDELKAHSELK